MLPAHEVQERIAAARRWYMILDQLKAGQLVMAERKKAASGKSRP